MTHAVLVAGADLPPLAVEAISRKTLALFAGASGDHQPTHIDIDAAKAKGRPDVIAHGMLVMAYLSRLLLQVVPQSAIRSYNARFVAVTPVHGQLTCSGRVLQVDEGLATLELTVCLADGTVVLRGDAVVEVG
jgi:acyl dehydratase